MMCESDMVTLRRAEAQVQYMNCAESVLTMHVYFTHCASARGRALQKNKVRLGIHLRREWDCMSCLYDTTPYSEFLFLMNAITQLLYPYLSNLCQFTLS